MHTFRANVPTMNARRWAFVLIVLAGTGCKPPPLGANFEDPHGPVSWQPGNWNVIWQDEFDGAAGTAPDPTRWTYDLGGDGWGNKELQNYTSSPTNAAMDGAGNLVITARAEMSGTNAYSSARITTKGLFERAYGRYEARMKLPKGRGLWPAFWIMGTDVDTVGWPQAGEVDVMEERGSDVSLIYGSIHGPTTPKTDLPVTAAITVPGGADADFHVYAFEWDPTNLVFLMDETPYLQITPQRRPDYAPWVWNHPFYILVNLAVGGLFGGPPDATTPFPATLTVDYVRVSVRTDSDAGVTDAVTAAQSDLSRARRD